MNKIVIITMTDAISDIQDSGSRITTWMWFTVTYKVVGLSDLHINRTTIYILTEVGYCRYL